MTTHLLIAVLCLVWGASWVVIKIGLADAPPFMAATLRFVIAVVFLGALVFFGRRPQPQGRTTWWRVLAPGVFMYTIPYASVYYAAPFIPAALSAVLFATFPFFVAILAHYFLPNERLDIIKLLGLTGGFLGIVVIFIDGLSVPDPRVIPAMLIVLLSPAAASLASVWLKKYLTGVDSVSATFWQMTVGAVFLLPMAFGWEDPADFHWTLATVGAAAFLGIFASALAFVIYLHLLKTQEATRMSLVAFVTPLVTVVVGWLVLGERLGVETLFGGLLVLGGLFCVLVWAPQRQRLDAGRVRK
jgi:drug/metabolite transporter (DMT)-like permease